MAKKITQKVLKYTAVFEPCEEGGYVVMVPKMPGLVTEGDTFEQAVEMAKDAIDGYLQVLQTSGEPLPEPDEKSFSTTIDVKLGNWATG
jgi:predicted RNase H-like HicB family nuclease